VARTRRPAANARRRVRLTARDRELLGFMAEHRLVLAAHIQALLDVSGSAAAARLRALGVAGYVNSERIFHAQPAAHRVTRQGLRAIGSEIPAPRIDLRCYQHDVGLAWLWLAAHGGRFGPMREVIGERAMRSRDGEPNRQGQPLGVRLGGLGPHGRERLHYPDLVLVTPQGHRIGVELELSAKGQARREKILAGYGSDPRYDAVLYLVKDRAVAESIQASARRLGISSRVQVQWALSPGRAAGPPAGRAASAQRARSPRAAGAHGPAIEAAR
jgi:hypothetical protein